MFSKTPIGKEWLNRAIPHRSENRTFPTLADEHAAGKRASPALIMPATIAGSDNPSTGALPDRDVSPLRRRMTEEVTIRNMALNPQKAYVRAVQNFNRHFMKSPDKLSFENVREYQLQTRRAVRALVERKAGRISAHSCPRAAIPSVDEDEQTPADQGRSGYLAHAVTEWEQLLDKHQERQPSDPKYVHEAPHEQKPHQHPAASEAECPVPRARANRAEGTLPPVSSEKINRRSAVSQARFFPGRPLIDAGGDQQQCCENDAAARHRLGKQSGLIESKLQGRCC
jgi:hypothetical protein